MLLSSVIKVTPETKYGTKQMTCLSNHIFCINTAICNSNLPDCSANTMLKILKRFQEKTIKFWMVPEKSGLLNVCILCGNWQLTSIIILMIHDC